MRVTGCQTAHETSYSHIPLNVINSSPSFSPITHGHRPSTQREDGTVSEKVKEACEQTCEHVKVHILDTMTCHHLKR